VEDESEKMMLKEVPTYAGALEERLHRDLDDHRRILEEYPLEHVEDALRDRVIVYMGDKESERRGTEEDVLEIGALTYLLWLRKRKEHLI